MAARKPAQQKAEELDVAPDAPGPRKITPMHMEHDESQDGSPMTMRPDWVVERPPIGTLNKETAAEPDDAPASKAAVALP